MSPYLPSCQNIAVPESGVDPTGSGIAAILGIAHETNNSSATIKISVSVSMLYFLINDISCGIILVVLNIIEYKGQIFPACLYLVS